MNTCETCKYWNCLEELRGEDFKHIGYCGCCLHTGMVIVGDAVIWTGRKWTCPDYKMKNTEAKYSDFQSIKEIYP